MATTIKNVKRTPAELHELFKSAEQGFYTLDENGNLVRVSVVIKCLSTDSYVALEHRGLNVGDPMAFSAKTGNATTKGF
tara:strand:- start:562 stop:798 length:237 start_codon:yes stop_codon:yes gene_type:complete